MSFFIRSGFDRLLLAVALALNFGFAAAAPKAYIGNFADNTVSVLDTATNKVIATIPTEPGPHGMAISQDGRTVYVSGDGSSSLSVIDTATDRVVQTVQVGKTPNGVALTPDGRLLLVTIYAEDRVTFLDTATRSVVASVGVPKPHTVSISPDGKLAYITSQEPGHFALSVIDLAARAVVRSIPLEKTPRDAEFGYDGKAAYVTNEGSNDVSVVDIATGTTMAVGVGKAPRKIVVQQATEQPSGTGSSVSIAGFAFGPQAITVKAGGSVTWSNDDGSPHTVTFKDGSAGAKSLSPGEKFSRVFDRAGTYDYFCSFHPYMTGRVIVNAN